MKQEEFNQLLKLMEERDSIMRANILKTSIVIERCMELVIGRYYCKDEATRKHFNECIMWNRMFAFDFKRQIFELVLEKSKPLFKDKYATEIGYIEKVGSYRNVVAHALIDTSIESVALFNKSRTLYYVRYEKGKRKNTIFDQDKVDELDSIFNKIAFMISSLAGHQETPESSPSK